jgi:hypothetical protein
MNLTGNFGGYPVPHFGGTDFAATRGHDVGGSATLVERLPDGLKNRVVGLGEAAGLF